MKLVVAKVPESEIATQFSRVGRILDFAGASDRRVACNASVPTANVAALEARYAKIKDWSRTLTGRFSAAAMLRELAAERVLSLHVKTTTAQLMIEPESERPFQDWNGEWQNTFRVVLTAEESGPASAALMRFAQGKGLKPSRSEMHDDGRVLAMRSFIALRPANVKELWECFLQGDIFPATAYGSASYIGEIASLPGIGGSSAFERSSEMQPALVFGLVAKQIKALNQTLAWAQGFYEALSLGGGSIAFSIEREYLNWKTAAGESVRGSGFNAVRLRANQKGSELTVQFEQFTDSAPRASELKATFQRFWREAQNEPTRQP